MENTSLPLDWDEILPKNVGIFYRNRWSEYAKDYGVPLSRGTMQNLDHNGRGPEGAVVIVGKVAYRRESLVKFLNALPMTLFSKRNGKSA